MVTSFRSVAVMDAQSIPSAALRQHIANSYEPVVFKNSFAENVLIEYRSTVSYDQILELFRRDDAPSNDDARQCYLDYDSSALKDSITECDSMTSVQGIYKQDYNPYFGPYYDIQRPYHQLNTIQRYNFYHSNISLSVRSFYEIFYGIDTVKEQQSSLDSSHPPYYALATDISTLNINNTSWEDINKILALLSTKHRSSINMWFGKYPGTTPCHYDGYHNLYVQIHGRKRFYFLHSESTLRVSSNYTKESSNSFASPSYPFLHPSYGQCLNILSSTILDIVSRGTNDDDSAKGSNGGNIYEVILEPGDMLYIPPFWVHEVTLLACLRCML